MKTTIIAVILSATAAFAAATFVYKPTEYPVAKALPEVAFDAGLPVADRIAALEWAVGEERQARQLLQEEVLILTAELEDLRPVAETEAADEPRQDRRSESSAEERRQAFARRNSAEGRAERLIEAGFLPSQAAWIVEREQQLQMEALQARYEAGQSGNPADFYRQTVSTGNALREELGDADYERYLEANGRSTSVAISSVIGSSPAQTAGLQPGDEIVRYDGERVFSMTDVNMVSMDGLAGQNVAVDIVRDGISMQVVMPRGPLGVTGGRRGGRP